ncbi:MGMT family protein [Nicoliella spurrieriana]|uniref:MGMT family protein n=1 Tax=Nicoliella spurrieriana TaxID=2925830 RepID=A0A976X6H8_9LACO|nr:MGMT family protein [Nicoliella spurrieriana]UQS87406.1 MGMT family protein [Nicoliella spurrieriana]
MEKLYWDTIQLSNQKLYFTVNNNGLNFISDPNQNLSQVYDFYPHAQFEFRKQPAVTNRYVETFENYILGDQKQLRLPIDIAAAGNSALRKVWRVIYQIPYGSIETVQSVAAQAGVKKETVERALRESPLTMIIPVHRVFCPENLGQDLRGGVAMRTQLIEMEAMNGLDDIE